MKIVKNRNKIADRFAASFGADRAANGKMEKNPVYQ